MNGRIEYGNRGMEINKSLLSFLYPNKPYNRAQCSLSSELVLPYIKEDKGS